MGNVSIYTEGLNRSSGYDWGLVVTKKADPDDASDLLRVNKMTPPASNIAFHYQTDDRVKGCGRPAGEWVCGVKLVFDGGRVHLCGNCQSEVARIKAEVEAQRKADQIASVKKWHKIRKDAKLMAERQEKILRERRRMEAKREAADERKKQTAVVIKADGVETMYPNVKAAAEALGVSESTISRWIAGEGIKYTLARYATSSTYRDNQGKGMVKAIYITADGVEQRFESIRAAARHFGVSDGAVKFWAITGGNYARKLLARYEGDDYIRQDVNEPVSRKNMPIRAWKDGKSTDYRSLGEASTATGKSRSTIEKKIFSGRPTEDGYRFEVIKT